MKTLVVLILSCVMTASALAEDNSTSLEQNVETQVMAVLDEFMRSFNALDIDAHKMTYHFPHYRLASGRMNVLEKASDLNQQDLKNFLKGIGWHHSEWGNREIAMQSADKVHVDTSFTRYREDGSVIGTYSSLYILTRENDHWGIKLRSSFAQ